MVQEPQTMDELGISDDVEKLLKDAEAGARSLITEPTERWKSKSNLITNDGQPLPERVRVWRTQSGREAWLPTAMIRQMMAKKHSNGQPVFSRTPPEGKQLQPIDQGCDICLQREIKKVFYSVYDYEGHMDTFHPREWQSKIREQERLERLEDREILRALASANAPKQASEAVKARMAKARAAKGKKNGNDTRADAVADSGDSGVDAVQ